MHHDTDKVVNLDRLRSIAAYDLFNPDLAVELAEICARSAEQLAMPTAAVQAVLDTATATIASNDNTMVEAGGAANEMSICPAVVATEAAVVVDDLSAHPAHRDNPFVQAGFLRSYAGVPLRLPDGHLLGSHCVVSAGPHHFTDGEVATLTANGRAIVEAITRHPLTADH